MPDACPSAVTQGARVEAPQRSGDHHAVRCRQRRPAGAGRASAGGERAPAEAVPAALAGEFCPDVHDWLSGPPRILGMARQQARSPARRCTTVPRCSRPGHKSARPPGTGRWAAAAVRHCWSKAAGSVRNGKASNEYHADVVFAGAETSRSPGLDLRLDHAGEDLAVSLRFPAIAGRCAVPRRG